MSVKELLDRLIERKENKKSLEWFSLINLVKESLVFLERVARRTAVSFPSISSK
jgi:hypothetical protein